MERKRRKAKEIRRMKSIFCEFMITHTRATHNVFLFGQGQTLNVWMYLKHTKKYMSKSCFLRFVANFPAETLWR